VAAAGEDDQVGVVVLGEGDDAAGVVVVLHRLVPGVQGAQLVGQPGAERLQAMDHPASVLLPEVGHVGRELDLPAGDGPWVLIDVQQREASLVERGDSGRVLERHPGGLREVDGGNDGAERAAVVLAGDEHGARGRAGDARGDGADAAGGVERRVRTDHHQVGRAFAGKVDDLAHGLADGRVQPDPRAVVGRRSEAVPPPDRVGRLIGGRRDGHEDHGGRHVIDDRLDGIHRLDARSAVPPTPDRDGPRANAARLLESGGGTLREINGCDDPAIGDHKFLPRPRGRDDAHVQCTSKA